MKCFFSYGLPVDISWKFYNNGTDTWDGTFIQLVEATCTRLQSNENHYSPVSVLYEDTDSATYDYVYHDYLDAFPSHAATIADYSWIMNLIIAIIFVIILFYVRYMLATATNTGMTISEKGDLFISMAILIAVGIIIIMLIANG